MRSREDKKLGTQCFQPSVAELWRAWKKEHVRQRRIMLLSISQLLFLPPKIQTKEKRRNMDVIENRRNKKSL